MPKDTHINVTISFHNWGGPEYDLRIPAHQPIKQLLVNLADVLKLDDSNIERCAIKIPTKRLLLTDDDRLIDFQVTDGDRLIVL